jgi:CBS domain-containing protein
MEIREHMKKDVKTCKEDNSVAVAARKMADYNIGSLIVVKEDNPVGIFTERDLVKRVIALGKDPSKVRVGDVMTRELITVDAGESVGAAYHIMVARGVRHVPVVQKGRLVGIISQKDLGKVLDERFYMTYFGKYGKPDLSGQY